MEKNRDIWWERACIVLKVIQIVVFLTIYTLGQKKSPVSGYRSASKSVQRRIFYLFYFLQSISNVKILKTVEKGINKEYFL